MNATSDIRPLPSRRGAEIALRRISRLAVIDGPGRAALADLDILTERAPGEVLCDARQGEPPCFILSGWVAWERWLPNRRRQIVRLLLPGDSLALGEGPRNTTGLRAIALTRVCLIDASALSDALISGEGQWSTVAEALSEGGRRFERQLVDQVVRLGRQNASERICHLLLEVRDRLRAVDLGSETEFPFPLTQEMLADATGLSIVHINRTLQQLRRDGLIELRYGVAHLLQPQAVEILADYLVTTDDYAGAAP